ncbi:MAG: lipocalin family protein, partial [Alcanivoracaceae bacterium]|nr:lipocalin family protein [Alcanivoracaceae bacterium]
DIPRFMGDWYVIAHIPLPPERRAWNGIERYDLNDDGSIATTFTFRQGGADGEKKRYTPTAWVTDDPSNAVWKMQFLWPFKADFRIIWLDDNYQTTIIGRQKRDYVWVMARQPAIDEPTYQTMLEFLEQEGYELSKLRRVPQQW